MDVRHLGLVGLGKGPQIFFFLQQNGRSCSRGLGHGHRMAESWVGGWGYGADVEGRLKPDEALHWNHPCRQLCFD